MIEVLNIIATLEKNMKSIINEIYIHGSYVWV